MAADFKDVVESTIYFPLCCDIKGQDTSGYSDLPCIVKKAIYLAISMAKLNV